MFVLEQPDVELRVLITQRRHDGRQQHVRHALERPDVDAPALAGEEPLDRISGGVDAGDDLPGVGQHDLPERRQLHGPWTTGPVEQRSSDEAFQGGDLLAHR